MCDHPQHRDPFRLRHRFEMPLIWLSFIVTVLGVVLALWMLSLSEEEMSALFGEDAEAIAETANVGLVVLILPLGMYLYRFYLAARAKANAVRIGPKQFPAIWALYQDLGKRLEMPRLPKLYMTNGNGVVNAYALSCNSRHKYVVLHSEVALAYEEQPEVVEFVLAHELAHHKLRHVSLWRIVIGFIPNLMVPLGVSTTRAQEYSADRVALSVCGHHEGAMKLLAVGPWTQAGVDAESWLEQCHEEHREFYVRLANLMSSHAVMVKRFKALRDIEKQGFSTHGSMF